MYTIKGKTSLDSNDRIIYKPIERFIRNKEKEVYVPGSSVKGFISNILKLLNKKDKNNVHISNRLRISDSKPISVNNLFISRVSYYRELYGSKNQRALPKDGQSNYVEFIKPGVEIEFNVTIDTDYINLEKFEEELKFFNNNYFDMYQSYYEVSEKPGQFDDLSNNDAMYEGSVFRLGKYTNFLTKTNHLLNKFKGNDYELYYLLKKENQYQRIFNFPKKLKNKLQKQVDFEKRYPLALKLSYNPDGYYRENGICSFRFEEIK
jgi:CRISPR/Cas system CSM-associated protein Csm5 (group 7 of RAMP superfamily)